MITAMQMSKMRAAVALTEARCKLVEIRSLISLEHSDVIKLDGMLITIDGLFANQIAPSTAAEEDERR